MSRLTAYRNKNAQMLADIQKLEFGIHVLDVLEKRGETDAIRQIFANSGISQESVSGDYSVESISGFIRKISDLFVRDYAKAIREIDQELNKELSKELLDYESLHKEFIDILGAQKEAWSDPEANVAIQEARKTKMPEAYPRDSINIKGASKAISMIAQTSSIIADTLANNKPSPEWKYKEMKNNPLKDGGVYGAYLTDYDGFQFTYITKNTDVVTVLNELAAIRIDFGDTYKKVFAHAKELIKTIPKDTEDRDQQKIALRQLRDVASFLNDCLDTLSAAISCLYSRGSILKEIRNAYEALPNI